MSQLTSPQPSRARKPLPARRDFIALEQRRMQAGELFARGQRPTQVARQLGVSVQSASRWLERWQMLGMEGLRGAGRAGRLPRLSAKEIRRVEAALKKGARANGFRNELWTLARVAEVIVRETGVVYHPGHVWRILRGLGWSRQKPSRWAAERDPEQVEVWVKERWPELKRGPSELEPGSSSRTRAASR